MNDSADAEGMYLRENLLGASASFRITTQRLVRFSRCDAPVLIVGETGTGKELAARAVHYLSAGRDRAFVPVNCASLPDGLVDSELFGHAKGAFTDARRAHAGLIRQADGGTLFLDEVEALSQRAQATLLRFLQDSSYRAVGAEASQQANVRIIAASNLDLPNQVKAKAFRDDLLYRLDVLRVEMPPLRERREDIALLATHLLDKAARRTSHRSKHLAAGALDVLRRFDWPGNIRQLEHVLLRVHLLCEAEEITADDLRSCAPELDASAAASRTAPTSRSLREAKHLALDTVEREYIAAVLSRSMGNISEAARLCGMQRASFSKLAKKHRMATVPAELGDGPHSAD